MNSLIDRITSTVKDAVLSYPNVSSGELVYNSKVNLTGKGKITLICTTASYFSTDVEIVIDNCKNEISMGAEKTSSSSSADIARNGVNNITLTFESSCAVVLKSDNNASHVQYIVQLAD